MAGDILSGMGARWFAPLIVLAPLLVAAPASGLSCVPFSQQKPHSSFTGTIVQQRGAVYQVAVREVWSGPDLIERTWIRFDDLGEVPAPVIGQAWVIYADVAGRANTCTATPDSKGAERLRPSKVRAAKPSTWWSAIRTSLLLTSLLAPVTAIDETG